MKTIETPHRKFSKVWHSINQRCSDKNNQFYGKKGIKVLWKSFQDFKSDMWESFLVHNEKHGGKETSIDRIDPSGHYCKENCRWATAKEQARNTRRNRLIEYKGEVLTLTEWSQRVGLKIHTLRRRLVVSKWSVEKSLNTPVWKG